MARSNTLQTVTLGPKGPEVPALGLGTWSWGDSLFWQYGSAYGIDEVRAAFKASLAAGVNFFDTAEIYGFGKSEELIGQFIKESSRPAVIATKYMPAPWRFSAQSVADTLSASLKRLKQSSVALYQVHWPFDFLMSQKTLMNALADEVEQGRIQAVGVSNYSAKQMREAHSYLAQRGIPLAVNQVQYSLLHRNIEANGVLEAAQNLEVTILAYSPLAQGLLTGKYTVGSDLQPAGARKLDPKFSQKGLQKIEPVLAALQSIGKTYGKTPVQVALNWLICQGNIVPIPGAKNAKQAEQNAGALGWAMTESECEQLSNVSLPWVK
ncbi:aldo/keto reductase [cf. Phormidesmis sp. LEGE 11477]|uniref:aldo/keto reductase n=1 Tax=cf. Phormidesmis sp. LEGE 11477 TaxID=1828680 RepID=UPI0018808D21|nr:aldo/keto reductase [cf. Phormidesmis sp. LEGE 11477]MBE9062171.1 aldo/keto reductase [cf. Phormidesmis sp. LEGE 11477]